MLQYLYEMLEIEAKELRRMYFVWHFSLAASLSKYHFLWSIWRIKWQYLPMLPIYAQCFYAGDEIIISYDTLQSSFTTAQYVRDNSKSRNKIAGCLIFDEACRIDASTGVRRNYMFHSHNVACFGLMASRLAQKYFSMTMKFCLIVRNFSWKSMEENDWYALMK